MPRAAALDAVLICLSAGRRKQGSLPTPMPLGKYEKLLEIRHLLWIAFAAGLHTQGNENERRLEDEYAYRKGRFPQVSLGGQVSLYSIY